MGFDPQAIIDKAIELVAKANRLGVAIETALNAFREQLFPTMKAATLGEASALSACPPELQADILDAVDACKTAE